ncbi:MAG: hypothetical protein LUG90_04710, partial [Clostridiaceae bacterium]|nr:hypothetical protein [Clostridiaceae bacterium]
MVDQAAEKWYILIIQQLSEYNNVFMNSNHTFLKPGKRKEKRMDTYSSIFTRASTRKFDSAPLS